MAQHLHTTGTAQTPLHILYQTPAGSLWILDNILKVFVWLSACAPSRSSMTVGSCCCGSGSGGGSGRHGARDVAGGCGHDVVGGARRRGRRGGRQRGRRTTTATATTTTGALVSLIAAARQLGRLPDGLVPVSTIQKVYRRYLRLDRTSLSTDATVCIYAVDESNKHGQGNAGDAEAAGSSLSKN
jgi:hypothetical protein